MLRECESGQKLPNIKVADEIPAVAATDNTNALDCCVAHAITPCGNNLAGTCGIRK